MFILEKAGILNMNVPFSALTSLCERWTSILEELRRQERFRSLRPPAGFDLSSNDYLGYGNGRRPPLAHTAAIRAGSLYGGDLPHTGMASRLLRGHHPIWDEVESRLAAWHKAEAVLIMNSGFVANEGLIATVVEPGDWVASDELSHACIIEGIRLCRPRKFFFRHNDLNHLEEGLRSEAAKRPQGREMFIVTESLFSMDGDCPPLDVVVALGERYGAHVIVDEAHATGCFGPSGSGLVDKEGVRARVLASVHTGGKALGAPGAYICGSQLLKDYLVNRCRHLIFTTALPPALGPWWLEAIDRVQADDEGRQALHSAARLFRAELTRQGVRAGGEHYIVPILLGEDGRAVQAARRLQEQGYDIRAIRPPSVPAGTARLRLSLHADHPFDMLLRLAGDIARACGV
jgi:8-amino-7-oxononanoate synthase